jgi:hypothetical protein
MTAGLAVFILLALFALCIFENPVTQRRSKVDLKRLRTIFDDGPPDIVRRSYEVWKDGRRIHYQYRGSERHAVPTAYHLNEAGSHLNRIAHHDKMAGMQERHQGRLLDLQLDDQKDAQDKERLLEQDVKKHDQLYQRKKEQHDRKMTVIAKESDRIFNQQVKAEEKYRDYKDKLND